MYVVLSLTLLVAEEWVSSVLAVKLCYSLQNHSDYPYLFVCLYLVSLCVKWKNINVSVEENSRFCHLNAVSDGQTEGNLKQSKERIHLVCTNY